MAYSGRPPGAFQKAPRETRKRGLYAGLGCDFDDLENSAHADADNKIVVAFLGRLVVSVGFCFVFRVLDEVFDSRFNVLLFFNRGNDAQGGENVRCNEFTHGLRLLGPVDFIGRRFEIVRVIVARENDLNARLVVVLG